MRSGNPTLNQNTFLDVSTGRLVAGASASGDVMTLNGTVNKTGFLLLLVVASAAYTWNMYTGPESLPALMPYMWGGIIGGLILAVLTVFKKTWSPITAPMYAVVKGLAVGGISVWFEARFPGIVMQAVMLTMGVMASLLLAYKSGLIKATENFKLGVVAATGGIMILYLVQMGLQFMGIPGMGFIHEASTFGILFSVFVVIIAALNLVLDFDFIETGVEAGAPKYMEWYGAFGLTVTLIWLYLEILRLLAKLQSRD